MVVDLEKIKSILEWFVPWNVIEIISFMGLTRYYRIFIQGFSNFGHTITKLQNKGVRFHWTLGHATNFEN